MKKSEVGPSSIVNENNNAKLQNSALQIGCHPSGDDDDEVSQSIELASLHSSSKKIKKKKKKDKKSKSSKKATDETDESVVSSPRLKKKKRKKAKDGKKKSKRISKKDCQSQSSCSTFDFYSSISSIETFAFDDVSEQSDQDSCYKSTTGYAHTPVGRPKKKLEVPSSAPLGKERNKSPVATKSPSASLGVWKLSPKQPEPSMAVRRARCTRRASLAGASMLNNSYHGCTPTLTKRMTAKIEKSLHDSMPDLFASPGRGLLADASPAPGRGRRRHRLKSDDNKAWTPRAPTLTRKISSKSLMDGIGNSLMNSFVSGSDSSLDCPFKSPTQHKQAPIPLSIPDLCGDSSDDDDGDLAYNNAIARFIGHGSNSNVDAGKDDNPFELVTPSRQSSTLMDGRQPSKAYFEHENRKIGSIVTSRKGLGSLSSVKGLGSLSSVSPMPNKTSNAFHAPATPPVQEHDDSSESSFATDGFLTPTDHGPLKKMILDNHIGEKNNNTDDDDRSLDVADIFVTASNPLPTENGQGDVGNVEESHSDSESDFGFDSPFGAVGDETSKKIVRNKKLSRKNLAPTGSFGEDMNRSFHEALSIDPFEAEEFVAEPFSQPASRKHQNSFRGNVLAPTGSFGEDMNRSFHEALSIDPFESEEFMTEPIYPQRVSSKQKSFSGKVLSDTGSLGGEMNRSFHDAMSIDPFESEVFKAEDFGTETNDFGCKVVSTSRSTNGGSIEGMNQSFHDALSVHSFELEEMGGAERDKIVGNRPGMSAREPRKVSCNDDSTSTRSFGASGPIDNAGSNSITKNRKSSSVRKSKSPKGSHRSKSLDRLKSLGGRSNSLDKLKLLDRRSNSRDSLNSRNRQSSIDDLIALQQRGTPANPWNRIRSAMSLVSIGSRSSQATKVTDPGPSSRTSPWNKRSTKEKSSRAGRFKRSGKSELSQSEHGVYGTDTRLSSSVGTSRTSKLSRFSSKEKLAKRKKKTKKNTLGQSEHSTRATDSLAIEQELGTTGTTTKRRAKGSNTKSKSPASSVSGMPQSKEDESSQDLFQDFVKEIRAINPSEDIFSC
ncbi:unnamed protein product [Cylindrotheca closterium]|uniref:Uncharacterized protein n=1 Tax=Cylindrotheca closterium TaxID=2856 RepID=A0AAD2JGJ7_9STRA|nr:unnamed protein product [Cylindrotheca closterium]